MSLKIFFLSLLTAVTAIAGPETWLQNGLLTPEELAALKPELSLSAEQESRIETIVSAAREKAQPLEQALREQQKAFQALMRNRNSRAEEAAAALTRLLDAEAPVKHLQLRTLLELRDILSPEQQKKALALAPHKTTKSADTASRVKAKAEKLRATVESLGVKPTTAMSERGREIEALLRESDWIAADAALDQLILESQAESPADVEAPDFSQCEPGNTDLEVLRQRLDEVQSKAQSILSIPLLRQFLLAKEALEEAKAAQDAERVGRILTWGERKLANQLP